MTVLTQSIRRHHVTTSVWSLWVLLSSLWKKGRSMEVQKFVYYEEIKRELTRIHIYGCRCNERLKVKTEGFTRLTYSRLLGGLGHLKKQTRLMIGERFENGMGERRSVLSKQIIFQFSFFFHFSCESIGTNLVKWHSGEKRRRGLPRLSPFFYSDVIHGLPRVPQSLGKWR